MPVPAGLFADVAPYPGGAEAATLGLILGGACFAFLFLVAAVAYFLLRGRAAPVEPGPGLLEDLATYPPPPVQAQRRLTVLGRPARLRLIVVAPMGKRDLRAYGEMEDLLNRVVPGLGDAAREDKARLRTWPPQLSKTGFAPTFFRNTERPQAPADRAHWSLLAGPAQAGDVPILLGIAVWSDQPGALGQRTLEPQQWAEWLRIDS